MSDIMNLTITKLSSANVNVPRVQIQCKIVDSSNQDIVLADLTGANAILFPAVIAQLTTEQRDEFVEMIINWLIRAKSGVT